MILDDDTITITSLKKICKIHRIKKYSGLKKCDLLLLINKYLSTLKIQQWIRKILSGRELCSISGDVIRYPCFAFKTEAGVLIYYNLDPLKQYLIKIGDFRDPLSRNNYNEQHLLVMDNIDKYWRLTRSTVGPSSGKFVSVYKASLNKKFYDKMKEQDCEILTFERILDSICQDIKTLIDTRAHNISSFLIDYRIQFKRLIIRSKSHAEYVINKNIDHFGVILYKETQYNVNQLKLVEYVIHYLFQLREELS